MKKLIRIDNPKTLDEKLILTELNNNKEVIVQYSENIYNPKSLSLLNNICEKSDENLCFRFYGYYPSCFDCSNLKYLPSVKSLFLDCLQNVSNFEEVKLLQQLKKLNIGIYNFDHKDFLSWNNLKKITYLCLVETKNNNIDLKYLEEYKDINTLFLNGHIKNINSISKLTKIKELSLCIPSKSSIDFINNLTELRKLKFILGGRNNLDEINNYSVEHLEIIRVKGFSSFKNISMFKNLRTLLIEDQIQLESIIFENEIISLSDIKIINCKTLNKIDGLSHLKNLNQIRIYKTNIDFNTFINQKLPDSLKILAFYTTKKQLDKEIKKKISEMGYFDGLENKENISIH